MITASLYFMPPDYARLGCSLRISRSVYENPAVVPFGLRSALTLLPQAWEALSYGTAESVAGVGDDASEGAGVIAFDCGRLLKYQFAKNISNAPNNADKIGTPISFLRLRLSHS